MTVRVVVCTDCEEVPPTVEYRGTGRRVIDHGGVIATFALADPMQHGCVDLDWWVKYDVIRTIKRWTLKGLPFVPEVGQVYAWDVDSTIPILPVP